MYISSPSTYHLMQPAEFSNHASEIILATATIPTKGAAGLSIGTALTTIPKKICMRSVGKRMTCSSVCYVRRLLKDTTMGFVFLAEVALAFVKQRPETCSSVATFAVELVLGVHKSCEYNTTAHELKNPHQEQPEGRILR
jgi:hypothetical protein